MRKQWTMAMLVLVASTAVMAEPREGKWEYTSTMKMEGGAAMPQAPQLPPGTKLPPGVQLPQPSPQLGLNRTRPLALPIAHQRRTRSCEPQWMLLSLVQRWKAPSGPH